jgi:hypothetical protein
MTELSGCFFRYCVCVGTPFNYLEALLMLLGAVFKQVFEPTGEKSHAAKVGAFAHFVSA